MAGNLKDSSYVNYQWRRSKIAKKYCVDRCPKRTRFANLKSILPVGKARFLCCLAVNLTEDEPRRIQGVLPFDSRLQSANNGRTFMDPLDFVKLSPLMKITSGKPEIVIGLIDGPVFKDHPDLAIENIREIAGKPSSACNRTDSAACVHGTYVAGVLSAKRGSLAPAICPNCTLLPRPIFTEAPSGMDKM